MSFTCKRSIQRHLGTGYSQFRKRKEQKAKNKVCNFCGMTFTKKCNRDRHVRSKHTGVVEQSVLNVGVVVHEKKS